VYDEIKAGGFEETIARGIVLLASYTTVDDGNDNAIVTGVTGVTGVGGGFITRVMRLYLPVGVCVTVIMTEVELATVWLGWSLTTYPVTSSVGPARVMILVSAELLVETEYDESGNEDSLFVIVS
jgi:hypothetical protein